MALRAAIHETQCILDNVMIIFSFVFYYKILSVLKYFVEKYLLSIMNTV